MMELALQLLGKAADNAPVTHQQLRQSQGQRGSLSFMSLMLPRGKINMGLRRPMQHREGLAFKLTP